MAALSSLRFDAALQSLKKADLLVDVQVFPEASLRFKHALIRTAVSGRIVSSALVELHRTALAELKAYYADGWRSTASAWPDTRSRLTFGTKPPATF